MVAGTSVLVMMAVAVRRSHQATMALTIAGLVVAFVRVWIGPDTSRQVTELLIIDKYSLLYFGLLIAADIVIVVLLYDYLRKRDVHREELYILLLIATVGAMVLASSSSLSRSSLDWKR
jgi:NADH-quinone oxidoreductase subunit N